MNRKLMQNTYRKELFINHIHLYITVIII